jgi:hypothetical protein
MPEDEGRACHDPCQSAPCRCILWCSRGRVDTCSCLSYRKRAIGADDLGPGAATGGPRRLPGRSAQGPQSMGAARVPVAL